MRIFTSYYKKVEQQGPRYTLVQVSNSKPSWFPWDVIELKEVYPKWAIVSGLKNGEISEDEFRDIYSEQLSKLDASVILDKLQYFSEQNNNKDVVLLCYEGSNKFCHRHILAEWLGQDIIELNG